MKTFIKNFIADESGASAAEYALIIAVVGVGIGAAALVLGTNVETAVGNAANDVYNCNKSDAGSSLDAGSYDPDADIC
ncbi:Flp family type IVb pilin [Croceicoccus sp. Ery15]|uniref:Flp family type IVb pilin n=1 Tax=Croceicoccus sp. Ery15 TaxID=1703338 RepID=UPI001E578FE5|nr:Flp family type IVb pilin [Croceicoccus sp. Ery15]